MSADEALVHPTFKLKTVIKLECRYCERPLCARAMRATLLADINVELFSTDFPAPGTIQPVGPQYKANTCLCKIRDTACLGCGNIVGYHVSIPCDDCLTSCNNGHFWMLYSEAAYPVERLAKNGLEIMVWGSIPSCAEDAEMDDITSYYYEEEECCR